MKQPRVGSIFIEVCVAVVVIAATLAMVAQLLALAHASSESSRCSSRPRGWPAT